MKTVKEIKREILELIEDIEKEEGKKTVIEIEVFFDNILPVDYEKHGFIGDTTIPVYTARLESAIYSLQEEGKIKVIENSSIQRS